MEFVRLLRDVQWHLVENHLDDATRAFLSLTCKQLYNEFFDPKMFGSRLFADCLKYGYRSGAHYCRDVLKCPMDLDLIHVLDDDTTMEALSLVADDLPGAMGSRRFSRCLGLAVSDENFERYKSLIYKTLGKSDLLKVHFVDGAACSGFIEHIPKLCPEFDLPYRTSHSSEPFINDNLRSLKFVWKRAFLSDVENPSPKSYFDMATITTREFLHQLYFTWLRKGTDILAWIIDGVINSERNDKMQIFTAAIVSERTFASFGRFGNFDALRLAMAIPKDVHCVSNSKLNDYLLAAFGTAVSHCQIDFINKVLDEGLIQKADYEKVFLDAIARMDKRMSWLKTFKVLWERLDGPKVFENHAMDTFLRINDPKVLDFLQDYGFTLIDENLSALRFVQNDVGVRVDFAKKAKTFLNFKNTLLWLKKNKSNLLGAEAVDYLKIDSPFVNRIVEHSIDDFRDPMAFKDAVEIYGSVLLEKIDFVSIRTIQEYKNLKLSIPRRVKNASVKELEEYILSNVSDDRRATLTDALKKTPELKAPVLHD